MKLIEPAHMKFLLALAVIFLLYFIRDCKTDTLHPVLVTTVIVLFACIGCGLQLYQYRLRVEETTVEALKVALREEVQSKRVSRGAIHRGPSDPPDRTDS